VPVALNYDRVLEGRTLLRSLDRELPRRSAWFAAHYDLAVLARPARPDAARPLVPVWLRLA
jgi:hypothetical protein